MVQVFYLIEYFTFIFSCGNFEAGEAVKLSLSGQSRLYVAKRVSQNGCSYCF